MADFSFRVTPEILRQKADEFSHLVRDIHIHLEQIEDISARTRSYWHGDAGNKDRDGYSSYKDEITYITRRLEEHPRDLLRMAGIYSGAEQRTAEVARSISTNGLV